MSWTDNNITDPQSTWGQGASNNSISWGQAAVNTISWGWGHIRSLGHAVTNLLGSIAEITEGWEFFASSNDATPLNTANALDGTTTPLSTITFDDLTGITITSQSGTGTYAISGNTIICTSVGTLYNLLLSNGAEFKFTEGDGYQVFSSDGTMSALISDFTWLQGETAGTQTALIDYSRYIRGEVAASNTITFNTPIPSPGAFNSYLEVRYQFYNGTPPSTQYILTGSSNSILFFLVANPIVRLRINGTNLSSTNVSSYYDGNFHTVRYQRIQGEGVDLFIDGNFIQNFALELDLPELVSIGGVTGIDKIVSYIDYNGYIYNAANNWGGGYTVNGTHTNVLIPQVGASGVDAIGEIITNPKLTDGYNFSGQSHYLDSGVTLTRTADSSDGFWFKCQNTEGGEVYASDDVCEIGSSATNYLQVTFNGTTLVSTQLLEFGEWYFVKFTQDGSGNGIIYCGTRYANPSVVASGAVGAATASSTTYKLSI